MSRKFHRYKLLLDEGFPLKTFFPRLHDRYDLKHIADDFKKSGLKDRDVYKVALKEKRLVITFNYKDFKIFGTISKSSGIIGISNNLSFEQIDKKVTALLMKKKPGELYGSSIFISGETKNS